jgi:hypothetical protein
VRESLIFRGIIMAFDSEIGRAPALVALRVVTFLGAAVFLLGFLVLVMRPDIAERRAHDYLVEHVTERASAMLLLPDSLADESVLGSLAVQFSARADSLRLRLDEGLAERLGNLLAGAGHYCEEEATELVAEVVEERIGFLQQAAEVTAEWAQDRYAATVTALVHYLRIFSGVNATLFLMVLGASLFVVSRGGGGYQLMLWLVLLTTGISILGYVFIQNWFYAVLSGEYIGFGYAIWVGSIFFVLADWVFNRFRISNAVVNLISGATSGVC